MSHCCTISFDEYKYRKSFHKKKKKKSTRIYENMITHHVLMHRALFYKLRTPLTPPTHSKP